MPKARIDTDDEAEVPLSGMLGEFRAALQSEIEAARKNEANLAVGLLNGRRIGRVAGKFQYIFNIESALNVPADSPADISVPGRPKQEAIIISVEGMAITISLDADLGDFVPNARLQSNLTYLLRRLIERIEAFSGKANAAGDRAIGNRPVNGKPISKLQLDGLNQDQADAVMTVLGYDTTFIWGPPGTGKTETIRRICEELYGKGRSVLLVSHTNSAVDQAIIRVRLPTEDLAAGLVIRLGEPKDSAAFQKRPELLLATHVDRRSEEFSERLILLRSELDKLGVEYGLLLKQIDLCEWVEVAQRDVQQMFQSYFEMDELEKRLVKQISSVEKLNLKSSYWKAAAAEAEVAQLDIQAGARSQNLVNEISQNHAELKARLAELENQRLTAQGLLDRTVEANWITRRWHRLPAPEEQRRTVEIAEAECDQLSKKVALIEQELVKANQVRDEYAEKVEVFVARFGKKPDKILADAEDFAVVFDAEQGGVDALANDCSRRRISLQALLADRLAALREWGLTEDESETVEEMLADIEIAVAAAVGEFGGVDLGDLRDRREVLGKQIDEKETDRRQVEEKLRRIEETIVAEARIVATTLTRAYLRDAIQSRRFDTVILDEASMAPIPALWVAAGLADASVVIVGDPQQLPPIVISQEDVAKKWLGRDIFLVAGVRSQPLPDHVVKLKTQYRMHPAIRETISAQFYGGDLKDGRVDDLDLADDRCAKGFLDWYNVSWVHDHPVVLVNTATVDAWVTSVSRGSRASRLNFLSATICVDIALQLLSDGRSTLERGSTPRILLACPYRPHARLMELLVREAGFEDEIRAGTAHTFQGAEADVVIFDLVNDEPHWRVGMFNPAQDEATRRLLNVALSRARRRLVIVGDFDYIQGQSRKAFLCSELVPFLRRQYPVVDALDVMPVGLSSRAARAQTAVVGGSIELPGEYSIVNQDHFYPLLLADLATAKKQIVIFSAFIMSDRLGQMDLPIRDAIDRGVQVYVVTKSLEERKQRELGGYQDREKKLAALGAVVIHKSGMHEKLVFVDDLVVWHGSLNVLSFSNTQEIMVRFQNRDVFAEFAKTQCLEKLLAEYGDGQPKCPICGAEMLAREGLLEPFYWRCIVDGCYSRGMDQPQIRDGEITCSNCGGELEHGEWGGEPHWRCRTNRQHRQRIAPTHLKLPKMRARIPIADLRELEHIFGSLSMVIDASRRADPGLF